MSSSLRLLFVEDHVGLALNLSEFFAGQRYETDFASDGLSALHLCATNDYDVLIVDIMLPGLSGLTLCRRIRSELGLSTPIILITAKDQIDDKEAGFREGADDYLVKPFDLRELQIRVEALHRRYAPEMSICLKAGELCFDPGTLRVTLGSEVALELSGTAARIFEALISAYPNLLTHDALHRQAWGNREADIHTLRTHVYSLRKQLYSCFGVPLIKTIHGRGYRLIPPGAE